MDTIHKWLNNSGFTVASFLSDYFHKLPIASKGNECEANALCNWQVVGGVLENCDADVMVCRQNALYDGTPPTTSQAGEQLCEAGYTILVRHAERHDPALKQLSGSFSEVFSGAVNVHIYVTPPDAYGFGWHYDAEDVFILQTQGSKEYSLRKNTVNPWPLVDAMPANLQYEREIMPLMRCLLNAGDWLYIPAGYWHKAEAKTFSISIAVGVLSPTLLDIYDYARQQLTRSLIMRQRLPNLCPAASSSVETEAEEVQACLNRLKLEFLQVVEHPAFCSQLLEHLRGH